MNDRIAHAKSYPFPIPAHSYVYADGGSARLDHADFERDGRLPVLAAGSNQSPEQLYRKYGHLDGAGAIPSQRGRLHDFDVVYAAHLTGYGSVPATFQASPGAAVTVFVLWLDAAQLSRMHETEGNYTFDHLTGVRIELDDGHGAMTEAYAYCAKFGCFNHEGACVSLAEIPAAGRSFRAAAQPEALGLLRDRLAPQTPLDDFIGHHLTDTTVRHERSRAMAVDALPLDFPRRTITTL